MKNNIPITTNFDKKPIGWMTIDCPFAITPDMYFGIGVVRKKDGTFELKEVSLITTNQPK
ncbi:hypothetical protein KAU11_09815 [Candidatus Babeliales bacterium]|nr:hypothetical protein [Candidatus Babeliales bacterium]